MEPLSRKTVYPSQYELDDILKRYPGWLTELSEGTIPNPELPATQEELLLRYLTEAAEEMGVYKQTGIPARRYLWWKIKDTSAEFSDMIREIIDKRDDAAFNLLNHLLEGPAEGGNMENEVEDALRIHKACSISYLDAAFIVRLFPVYADESKETRVADPRLDPSTLKVHLAMARLAKTISDVYPSTHGTVLVIKGVRFSDASLKHMECHAWQLHDPELISIAIDYADEIEAVCQFIIERGFDEVKELRAMVKPVIESLRNGGAASLVTGTL